MDVSFTIGMIKDTLELIHKDYPKEDLPVAIYPFGQDGIFAKYMLNNQFGITEKYLVDNNLCKYNPNVISGKELLDVEEDIIVLVSVVNPLINSSICKQIAESGNKHLKIYNITDPIICPIENNEEYYKELRDILHVRRAVGYDFVRVGRLNDGGYAMLDDFSDKMSAYSFGISDDMSWDVQINEMSGMNVHMYDHTIPCSPGYHKGCFFNRIGLGVTDDKEKNLKSLETVLTDNGELSEDRDLIMKMDIECAEWDVLGEMPESILKRFRQIVVEFHGMISDNDGSTFEKRLSVLRKLNNTHQVAWVHGNNCTGAVGNEEMTMPLSIEVLYLNRDCYEFTDENAELPLVIDMPNMPGRKDFDLSYLAK